MKQAVGYIRRSAQDQGGHVSREEQQRVCAELAERYGEALSEVYVDWGRSGVDPSPDQGRHIGGDVSEGRGLYVPMNQGGPGLARKVV